MMITLITGGCRSGKSSFAMEKASELSGDHFFIATCPVYDDSELNERILRHKLDRDRLGYWQTIEEELDHLKFFCRGPGVYLLDCLTLWMNNLIYHKKVTSESDAESICSEFIDNVKDLEGSLFIVTNEVGLGVVPENQNARLFRDIIGRVNQNIAKIADCVILMTSGIPQIIKGKK